MNNEATNAGPPTIDHVIGQKRAVEQLRVALAAHFNDRMAGKAKALGHILLCGPAGCGKSLMSRLIASELGVLDDFHEELAQNLTSPGHIHGFLLLVEQCAFLDELHELHPMAMTTLYRALEERRLFLGGDRRSITLPDFTFIGATTEEWALPKSLLDRFKIIVRMSHYSDEELAQIIAQRSKRLGWPIADEAVQQIARRGRNTPRITIRLLDASRRMSRSVDADTITEQHVEKMCAVEGIDELGLDPIERQYLELLREAQGPVRLNMLVSRLSSPRKSVEMIESELIRMRLVTKTDEGRMLTAEGITHLTASAD